MRISRHVPLFAHFTKFMRILGRALFLLTFYILGIIFKLKENMKILIIILLTTIASFADIKKGELLFKTYCSSCHGPQGAGLLGPNLTDKEVLHGSEKNQIINIIKNGIPGKAMPPWGSILKKDEMSDVADFVKSIMGKNLKGPNLTTNSTVTPFPKGDQHRPYLIRTFMPKMGLSDEVFVNHGKGHPTPKYNPGKGSFHKTKMDKPIEGIPGAIAVNLGDQLSYCFDTTECRLFYVWSGPFLDMSNYWGKGVGGGRKKFGYIAKVLGKVSYLTQGKAAVLGKPMFKGYRKVNNIPEFMYCINQIDFTLKIVPGNAPGEALCHYSATGMKSNLVMNFESAQISSNKGDLNNGTLTLNPSEAKSFTITITPAKEASK